jgi:hypothetical protein
VEQNKSLKHLQLHFKEHERGHHPDMTELSELDSLVYKSYTLKEEFLQIIKNNPKLKQLRIFLPSKIPIFPLRSDILQVLYLEFDAWNKMDISIYCPTLSKLAIKSFEGQFTIDCPQLQVLQVIEGRFQGVFGNLGKVTKLRINFSSVSYFSSKDLHLRIGKKFQ